MHDKDWLAEAGANPNMLVPFYLIGAYAYYVLDSPIMPDSTFDTICRGLDDQWDEIEHMHKFWIDRDDLAAGTRLSTAYPAMAMGAASALAGRPYRPSWGILDALAACEREMEQLCLTLNRR